MPYVLRSWLLTLEFWLLCLVPCALSLLLLTLCRMPYALCHLHNGQLATENGRGDPFWANFVARLDSRKLRASRSPSNSSWPDHQESLPGSRCDLIPVLQPPFALNERNPP